MKIPGKPSVALSAALLALFVTVPAALADEPTTPQMSAALAIWVGGINADADANMQRCINRDFGPTSAIALACAAQMLAMGRPQAIHYSLRDVLKDQCSARENDTYYCTFTMTLHQDGGVSAGVVNGITQTSAQRGVGLFAGSADGSFTFTPVR